MKPGIVFAILAVVGYAGLEHYAIKKARPRMEPDFMYQSRVEARVAVEACADVSPEQEADFERSVNRVLERLRRSWEDASTPSDSAAVERRIAELTSEAEARTREVLESEGCDSFMAKRLIRRHEIHAQRAGG